MYGQPRDNAGNSVKKPLHEYPPRDAIKDGSSIYSHFGIDTSRYNAISWLSEDTIIMAAGRFVLFVNIRTGTTDSQLCDDDAAAGVVAVHPSREYYVMGERRSRNPRMLVHSWPSREQVYTYEEGTSIGYAACSFNVSGTRMATVGAAPDFTLAVWDWPNRVMILRNKCFSADVHSVVFSPFDSSLLVTGGSGHIKFWTMANTFTGQKLQGTLGKFGRLEISNITGFVVFPDGKVLSGSENGCLLLWEGDLVKCSFVRDFKLSTGAGNKGPGVSTQSPIITACHDGTVNVVRMLYDGKIIASAGDDGCIRYWSKAEMDLAEGEGQPPLYAPRCLLEVCVSLTIQIRSMTLCGSDDAQEWVILDNSGVIVTAPLPTLKDIKSGKQPTSEAASAYVRFNGGGIMCCAVSPHSHCVVTGGEDGIVRLVDYLRGQELSCISWAAAEGTPCSPVTSLHFFTSDPSSDTVLTAQADGSVRLLKLSENTFTQIGQWKPHAGGLFAIAVQKDERRLCTVATDGTVFFFTVAADRGALHPIGFCQTPLAAPLCAEWDEEGGGCFLGYEGGQILSVRCPSPENVDHEETFQFVCAYTLIGIRQRKLPPPPEPGKELEEDMEGILEEEDNGPWAVNLIRRLPDGSLAIGMQKEELLYRYRATVRYPDMLQLPPLPPTGVEPPNYVEDPEENLSFRDTVANSAFLGPSQTELLIVCEHSEVILRDLKDLAQVSLLGQAHDSTFGHITGAQTSYDGSMIITTGTDGLVVSQVRKGYMAPSTALESVSIVEAVADEPVPALSIQEQKEADDRAKEEAAKQMALDKFLAEVAAIHVKYAQLLGVNSSLPADVRLGKDEIQLDPTLKEKLEAEKQSRVLESRKEYAVETAREDLRTQKLRNRFLDNLLFDRFVVKAFGGNFSVASFRTVNPGPAIERLKKSIENLQDSEECDEVKMEDSAIVQLVETPLNLDLQTGATLGVVEEDMAYLQTRINATVHRRLEKTDQRREERRERREGYEALLAAQPDPQEEDAALAAMVKKDLHERGECVLRTDRKYQGAAEFQPTADGKLHRMIHLETLMMERRTEFNQRVLAAREEKVAKLAVINDLRRRIGEINEALDDYSIGADPVSLTEEEQPEKAFEVTRESLGLYAKQKALRKLKEEEAKKAQRGFGADLAVATQQNTASSDAEMESPRKQGRYRLSKGDRGSRQSIIMNRERMKMELKTKLGNIRPTELEEEEMAMKRERLLAERRRLVQRCQQLMTAFDKSLYELFRHRVDVDADMCLADAHLLLLFREYQMLLVFRSKGAELRNHLRSVQHDHEKQRREIASLKASIESCEGSTTRLQEELKSNRHEAEEYIHENCPADRAPYILKVFLRYIKRRKNLDDDDLDDDITSDDEDDEDEIEDDVGEEVCPPNCPQVHWERVLVLREVRLDITDSIAEKKTKADQLRKSLGKVEEIVEALLAKMKAWEEGIEELETEKRRELNMLDTTVPLWCTQVKCLDEEQMCPSNVHDESVLVISEEELSRLNNRVFELAQQKENRRAEIVGMAAELQRLHEEKAETQKVHSKWEAQLNEVMMLKFGRLVDLEMLETCGCSRRIEAKKEELRKTEMRWEREVRQHENHIAALRERMQAQLIQNTHLLQEIGDYESERQMTEKALGYATTKTVERYRGVNVATKTDRENLRELITAQQEEMDALNAEIAMLRRKGGHAYSPSM